MAAQKSPLLGYNHNLKYKGRVYHVQTEDSGLDNPHIFTHLFHDGTILRSAKQEYHDLLGNPDWEATLRGRMQAQHKDMMKELIKGSCDERILSFFGTLEAEVEEEVPMATLPPAPKRERALPQGGSPATPLAPRSGPSAPPRFGAPASPESPPARSGPAPARGGVVVSMPMVIVGNQATASPQARPPAPVAHRPFPVSPPGTPLSDAQFRPEESKPVPDSIFGSDLISEKSLDEVILAYLSEDMIEE